MKTSNKKGFIKNDEAVNNFNKANEIITSFKQKSNFIYCLTGFKHLQIIENLELNCICFYDFKAFKQLQKGNLNQELSNKYIIFLTSFFSEFKAFKKALQECKLSTKKLNLLDIEVLKAYICLGIDEYYKNDCVLGFEVSGKGTLTDLTRDIKGEFDFTDNKKLYQFIKETLLTYEMRIQTKNRRKF